ncbi:hypothetical protein L873DRAFT_78932 [Choiromyces venosus 120613-1]|uniref:Uncharacterized protein n=1 Tax=Choiromyces venosus 120613-1 TaxID=1336337 RepID=A0A3N4J7G3_9PEZI|nr:hypothetical protein L873DRAFT_78932 [Choiromyces venosus 120613-1]
MFKNNVFPVVFPIESFRNSTSSGGVTFRVQRIRLLKSASFLQVACLSQRIVARQFIASTMWGYPKGIVRKSCKQLRLEINLHTQKLGRHAPLKAIQHGESTWVVYQPIFEKTDIGDNIARMGNSVPHLNHRRTSYSVQPLPTEKRPKKALSDSNSSLLTGVKL